MGWNRSLQEYNWPSREGIDRQKTYDPRKDGARCDICPLAGSPVVPSSPPKSGKTRLIVVGEGPGRVEERWGLPFIGPTGAYFNKLVEENAGDDPATRVSRDDMYIANTMACRGESDKDNATAAACCAPRLLKELAALPRDIPVLALGRAAAQATLGVRSILLSRGFVWNTKPIEQVALRAAARTALKGAKGEDIRTGIPKTEILKLRSAILQGRAAIAGRRVFPALHPAFVLRLETWAPILEIDIDRCFRAVRGEEIVLRDRGQYRVVSKAVNILRELGRLGGVVSTDVETDGKDPLTTKLVCVGVSDGVRTVVIHPGAGKIRGKAWKPYASDALTQFFKNCRAVVMHNGYNFDQVVLRQHGVDFEGVQLEDTLLAHHAFASHLPKKLDQVVSEYVDSGAWKVKHGRRGSGGGSEEKGLVPHKMPAKEVCLYNAADCRLTTIAWEGMQADLEEEREVYEHDKQISAICQQMLYDGIYMDRDRRAEVRRAMRKRGLELKQQMRALLKAPDFVPMRVADVRWAIFTKLKAPVFDFTPTGLPATSAATLEELRKMEGRVGRFCELLLNWRVVEKVRGTYLEAIPIAADGRVHYTWRPYGTVSGRWACRFQSLPRKTKEMLPEDRMGECYAAPPGHDFHYFDLCFARGTLVDTPTGAVPIEMLRKGDLVYTYRAATRRPAVGKVTEHIRVKGRAPIVKVTLDNGKVVRCTPDHKWLVCPHFQKDAPIERRAEDLRPGDRLLPLRKIYWRGSGARRRKRSAYEHLYAHSAIEWSKTHVEVARAALGPRPLGHDVHHRNENTLDNSKRNLEYKLASAHRSAHGKKVATANWANRRIRARMMKGLRENADRWVREGTFKGPRLYRVLPRSKITCEECGAVFLCRPARRFCSQACHKIHRRPKRPCLRCGCATKRGRTKFCSRSCWRAAVREGLNHKVVSVERDGFDEVWSIAVTPDHNYALAAGVFVKNCQSEMRAAAYISADPEFMRVAESGDVHAGNASILFPRQAELGYLRGGPDCAMCKEKRPHEVEECSNPKGSFGKGYRDIAKNAGFGILYSAEIDTIFGFLRGKGFDVQREDVVAMFDEIHRKYAVYYDYCNENIGRCRMSGHLRTALMGRIRWLGWFPKPGDVYNFPIQSFIADLMNIRLIELRRRLPRRVKVVAQIHDALVLEARQGKDSRITGELIKELWAEPVRIPTNGLEFVMPIDQKRGERLIEFR